MADLPLLSRYPELSTIPRASLGTFPTAVERVTLGEGRTLWVKRDDRSAALVGGNKVRGLEWLLGGIRGGDRVVTVGSTGSTHALATATYADELGARVAVVRWPQQMNPAALRVDAKVRHVADVIDAHSVPGAYVVAGVLRMKRRTLWIPAGGATPIAVLGHVNGALELAQQIARGECETPDRVVVPLGTGGTAAGLALGFRIAGLSTHVIAVRVVPRIVGRLRRVLRLAHATASIIERASNQRLPRVVASDVTIAHDFYGGGYGHALANGVDESALGKSGVVLDDTYSRKAFAAAAAEKSRSTLLWLTFDGRLLQD